MASAMATSLKSEFAQAGHCFLAPQTSLAGAGTSGQFTITGLASTANVAVGMAAAGTNVAAGAIVASIDSATQVTVSKAHTGTVTSGTISFTGDAFKIALIKVSPTGVYDATLSNAGTPNNSTGGTPSTTNIGTDDTAGTGYTAGGQALATNVNPATSGTTAFWSWTTNPSWTTSSFSATFAVIYNTATRVGASTFALSTNRVVGCYDLGGTQTVTAGTFSITLPTNAVGTAILRIS